MPQLDTFSAEARALLTRLDAVPHEERWALPFPMAVFGTLRAGMRNAGLMQRGRVAGHSRAFLPHFVARYITLLARPGASAPFEVCFYEPADWRTIIPQLDDLEDFDAAKASTGSYHRTLAWLHLLPAEFDHPSYALTMLGAERDLEIEPARWSGYERVPCWIYSSVRENEQMRALPDSPIIWDGTQPRSPSAPR